MLSELNRILVVDDDDAMRHMVQTLLRKKGYEVLATAKATEALSMLEHDPCDVVLSDIRMPEMDGLEFLSELKKSDIDTTAIMMSAYGSVELAIECIKNGAYDYISKPFKPDEVVLTLKKAEERLCLRRENDALREELASNRVNQNSSDLVWKSACMSRVIHLVNHVAESSSPVLITGETGTGKELVARSVHRQSNRKGKPFIAINCSAIPTNLIESELFGHIKGAFTGANSDKKGLFAAADGGTLFLDEIGEMPQELQPKLLRVLQENEIMRVGETRARKVDVRVVAATARDLEEMVAEDRFRDDLFYRLAVVEIRMPPLRERKEDIGALVDHMLNKIARRDVRSVPKVGPGVIEDLEKYHWPGNVRELENFIEKTMIFCRGEVIERQSLPWDSRRRERNMESGFSLKTAYRRLEKEYIQKALTTTKGNKTRASELLEISLRALHYKMKELGID